MTAHRCSKVNALISMRASHQKGAGVSFAEGIPGNSKSGIPVWKGNRVRCHTPIRRLISAFANTLACRNRTFQSVGGLTAGFKLPSDYLGPHITKAGKPSPLLTTPSSIDEINLGDTSAAYISCKCAWALAHSHTAGIQQKEPVVEAIPACLMPLNDLQSGVA